MNQLVFFVQNKMNIKRRNIRIPYFLAIFSAYFFDFFSYITSKKLIISSIRVKKFCAKTQFNSEKAHKEFTPPYTLEKGLYKTIQHEFISHKKDDVLFYSE